ncbi:lysosomal dipeptide transporter MFSD1-like [Argopecten irradians]|uniref:lysosomal dipeptide transporter MFSD1-like n=1 Tax=Argopecten irradians TaxID=31199 RepID=UPI00371968BE
MYILMVVGYASLAFGDTSLRITQTRIVSHCFTEATLFALVLCLFGYAGQGVSLFLTPFIATTAGFQLAVWTGPISCLIGVICAVGLTVILQRQSTSEESKQEQTLTLNMLKSLPYAYWMIIPTISLLGGCWVVRQANLPDYLELQHGYTSEDASRLTSISPSISLVLPFFFCVFNKLDCDGILSTSVHTWMTVFCVIIGFCPNVNVIFTLVADGIGIGMFSTFQWQLIVVLCPAAYLGTLGGLLFMVRNSIFALTFIAAGYTLQRGTITDIDEALLRYHRFFIMLICMSVIGILCGVLMNIVDYRQDGKLNGRMRSWKQSELENIGLISMGDSPDNYNATGRDCIDNT